MPNESPNSFVARVYDALHQEWRPLYQAPDSTDAVQGDVYLSDSVNSTLNAATGMTAATPAAVKAANDNANSRIPNTVGSVTNNNLAANSVTTDKIKDGTILGQDLASGTITGDKIANKTVTNDKLADNSVSSSNIIDGTIVNADLADKTITGNKIANNSITTDHITNGTILMEDLSEELQALINEGGDVEISVTPNRAVISDSTGTGIISSSVTSAELGYLSGVTSSVQTQLNNKAPLSHTHNYAGASSPGGPATSANRLATARTVQTDLGSENAVSFDGSANITPGVKGTLPIAHGGTGATTARAAEYNIMNQIRTVTSNVADSDMFVCKSTAPDVTNGATYARSFSTVYNSIQGKTDGRYLKLTGGELSGSLHSPGVTIRSSFMNDVGIAPSSSQVGNQLIFSVSDNNTRVGTIRANHTSSGQTGLEIMAVREGTTTEYAGFKILIDANGKYYVTPTNNAFIEAFKDGFNITNADICNFIYPVGSYYISNTNTKTPAQMFGGTWEEVTGKFLYANHGSGTGGTTRHRHMMYTGKEAGDDMYVLDLDGTIGSAAVVMGRSASDASKAFHGARFYAANKHSGSSGFSMETATGGSTMERVIAQTTSEPIVNLVNGGVKEVSYQYMPNALQDGGELLPPYQEVYAWRRTA